MRIEFFGEAPLSDVVEISGTQMPSAQGDFTVAYSARL